METVAEGLMVLYHFPAWIATQFQRQYQCFRGHAIQWDKSQYRETKRDWNVQDSGQHT